MLRRVACGEDHFRHGLTQRESWVGYNQLQLCMSDTLPCCVWRLRVETAYTVVSLNILTFFGISLPNKEGTNCLNPRRGRRV